MEKQNRKLKLRIFLIAYFPFRELFLYAARFIFDKFYSLYTADYYLHFCLLPK